MNNGNNDFRFCGNINLWLDSLMWYDYDLLPIKINFGVSMKIVMRDGIKTTYHFDDHNDIEDDDLGLIDEEDLEEYRKKKIAEHEKYMSDRYFDVTPIGIRV